MPSATYTCYWNCISSWTTLLTVSCQVNPKFRSLRSSCSAIREKPQCTNVYWHASHLCEKGTPAVLWPVLVANYVTFRQSWLMTVIKNNLLMHASTNYVEYSPCLRPIADEKWWAFCGIQKFITINKYCYVTFKKFVLSHPCVLCFVQSDNACRFSPYLSLTCSTL
jgi:hypothetical protein